MNEIAKFEKMIKEQVPASDGKNSELALWLAMKELRKQLKENRLTKSDVERSHKALCVAAEKDNKPCQRCGRHLPLTVDHIVPARVILELGFDSKYIFDPDNIQLFCHACNKFKGGQIDIANPKTLPILKKYIALLEETTHETS